MSRFEETKLQDDHVLKQDGYKILAIEDGRIVEREVSALSSLNERLRDDYITDSVRGIGRWNRIIDKAGIPFRLKVPHKAFNRKIGTFAGVPVSPDGQIITQAEWSRLERGWLPTAEDRAFVASLMGRVVAPGAFANWIAPPAVGVNRQLADFEYVRFN